MLLAVFCFQKTHAQNPDGTSLSDTIKEIVITAKSQQLTSISSHAEKISLSSQRLGNQAKILGNADAFRYIQLLPGVSTNNDYTTGTSIQGCEFSHSVVEMEGATLFYPYHLLGIFSTCNNDHFSNISIEKSIHSSDFANRLGGKIEIQPKKNLPEKLTGSADVGLISSGISMSIPISSKCGLILSGRISYLNALYSPLLENDENKLRYDFYDTNLTFLYRKDKYNTFTVNAMLGKDKISNFNKESYLDLKSKWNNFAFSSSWEHKGKIAHKTNIACSYFKNDISVLMPDFTINLPAKITQISIKENISCQLNEKWNLNSGIASDFHRILKNRSYSEGLYDNNKTFKGYNNDNETRLFGDITFSPDNNWAFSTGIKNTVYSTHNFNNFSTDPYFTLKYKHHKIGSLAVHAGIYHQYIHQAGLSACGLPMDFWFISDNYTPKQKAYSLAATWTHKIPRVNIDFSAEIYYKRMLNQLEFNGSVMNVILNENDLKSNLITSNGFNTGIDIMLQKRFGKISGWLSYSIGFARRKIPDLASGYVPSSRESLHNLSVTANYKHNELFSYAANFVFASGTPTTPIKSVFVIGENVLCEYGKFNSHNLPDYHRLDLSCTFTFPQKVNSRCSHSLNLSIVNAYANKNIALQYFSLSKESSSFIFKDISTMFKVLPSLSYRLEF